MIEKKDRKRPPRDGRDEGTGIFLNAFPADKTHYCLIGYQRRIGSSVSGLFGPCFLPSICANINLVSDKWRKMWCAYDFSFLESAFIFHKVYVRRRCCPLVGADVVHIREVLRACVATCYGAYINFNYQLQPPQTTIIVSANTSTLNNHDCSVSTCTAFPRPRQPVPAPASCDTSLGISESVLQMKFGSVNGIRSSLRGKAW